jgi:hypothetical protein
MAKKAANTTAQPSTQTQKAELAAALSAPAGKPSALLDTRVVYCGDCLEQLQKLPPACVDLIYIDPPFNSNRNYEVFWGETKAPPSPRLRRPPRQHPGLHRLHAPALRGTRPRAQENRQFLLPLRLALPLRNGGRMLRTN